MSTGAKSAVLALASAITVGCGGGGGLMHPAHALPPDRVTMGAGVSGQFVFGGADDRIQAARRAVADGAVTGDDEQQSYVEGALAHTLYAPGLAPWVGARAGIGYTSDAGLTYTARSVRIDGRHAFEFGDVALSAGLGASALLVRPGSDEPGDARVQDDKAIPGLDTGGVNGFGVDLPVIVGWRSSAELFQIWGGVRGTYERIGGKVLLGLNDGVTEAEEAPVEAYRVGVLGVLGFAVGIHPAMVAIELDGGYQHAEGSIRLAGGSRNGVLDGFTVTPTAAAIGKF